jgi:hypothetical protein
VAAEKQWLPRLLLLQLLLLLLLMMIMMIFLMMMMMMMMMMMETALEILKAARGLLLGSGAGL